MSTRGVAFVSAFLAVFGWVGLGYLVSNVQPQSIAILAFFSLLFATLTTTFIPVVCYLNHRFTNPREPPDGWRSMRQSGWLALFIVLCAWLQSLRVLNWIVALLLLGVFSLIEVFILTRE